MNVLYHPLITLSSMLDGVNGFLQVTPVNVLYSRATDELKVWMDNSAQPTKVLKLHRPRLHHLRLPKSVRPVISSRFGTLKSVKPF